LFVLEDESAGDGGGDGGGDDIACNNDLLEAGIRPAGTNARHGWCNRQQAQARSIYSDATADAVVILLSVPILLLDFVFVVLIDR